MNSVHLNYLRRERYKISGKAERAYACTKDLAFKYVTKFDLITLVFIFMFSNHIGRKLVHFCSSFERHETRRTQLLY